MSDRICLGKIMMAHGIKGEVKVKSFTSNLKDICAYGKLSNKDGTRFFELRFVGFSKELLRIKIKGVETRNDALALVGTELYVDRSVLPDLEKDTFYQTDLVGLKVMEKSGSKKIGEVVGVYNFGAGDILEIKFDGLKQTEMLPFNNEYIPVVDVKGGFIRVSTTTMAYMEEKDNEG